MELKATLNKPYTDKQRADFIVENNHTKGYEIKETEKALEAWGYSEEEKQEQERERRNQEINQKISELEQMAISDVLLGNKENVDTYNQVIASLRENLIY